MMLVVSLLLGILTVARFTRLLVDDQLTNGYRQWVIRRWGDLSWQSYLAHCPWCTSVWISILIMPVAALLPNIWTITALAVPAASMVTGLLLDRKE
jgi:peptidoglycan/LPS O-acetylase OafA/YrhL